MAGKSDAFETDLLRLIFNGTAIANLADNAASSPLTSLYVALHTADPGEAGTQSTNEISYTGYARVAVTRGSGAFTVTGNSVSPASVINFGMRTDTGASVTATHFSIGVAASGATKYLYAGALSPTITITQNVTPQLGTGTAITED